MSYKDLKEVRSCYTALREVVIQCDGGWDDVESRAKVARLCNAGVAALDDAECRERLRAVEAQASELFSREGHLKWKRKNLSGADYLRLQILIALEALNTRLFFIDTLRSRASLQQPGDDLAPPFEHQEVPFPGK
jgi:hypothetical protein